MERDWSRGDEGGGSRASPGSGASPGRRTRTPSRRPVQRRSAASERARAIRQKSADPQRVQEVADRGTSSGGGELPHLQRIQSSFGDHDLSGVRAHVGGEAAKASDAMGARGYAQGDKVAFRESPSLHTAAHEAAHVVQQRRGVQLKAGVGEDGDAYERHADAVADRVVSGKSAADLLGPSPGGGVRTRAVQKESVADQLEEKLSYGLTDWAVTDEEATAALDLLEGLGTEQLEKTLDSLGDKYVQRLLENLPESERSRDVYTKVLVALGPDKLLPYAEHLIHYGAFDWAVTDEDAKTLVEVIGRLGEDAEKKLFEKLEPEFQKRLFENIPDDEVALMQFVMKLRFKITFQASKSPEDLPEDWEAQGLRRLWSVLENLPEAHVEGNSALEFFERTKGDPKQTKGYFWPESRGGRNEAALQYDPEHIEEGVGDPYVEEGDPLQGKNAFDRAARHEVGHAVDEAGGFRQDYCLDNEDGGGWKQIATASAAAVVVAAADDVIENWPDPLKKMAIVNALQQCVDSSSPEDIDGAIDNLGGLSDEEKEQIKGDKAIEALKVGMNAPWHNAEDGGVALGERIYEESGSSWWSYLKDARKRKVSNYQFAAPAEWFAEAYATYYAPTDERGALLDSADSKTKEYFDEEVHPMAATRGGGGGS